MDKVQLKDGDIMLHSSKNCVLQPHMGDILEELQVRLDQTRKALLVKIAHGHSSGKLNKQFRDLIWAYKIIKEMAEQDKQD